MEQVDVVVCGAGLSGSLAAARLKEAGLRVALLEARDRLGGRTYTIMQGNTAVDLGGQWVGPTQTALLALARELDVPMYQGWQPGDSLFRSGGRNDVFAGGGLALPEGSMAALGTILDAFDVLSATVPPEAPQDTPDARRLDAMTLASWIDARDPPEDVRGFLSVACRALLGCEADEVSFLYWLFYLRQGDGFGTLASSSGGAQDTRFVGGTQQFAEKLAARLGSDVHLNAPVARIAQDDAGVTVTVRDGRCWHARYAILAMPPVAAAGITYDPPLPAARRDLHLRAPMGCYAKIIVGYDRPFWRDAGLSGEAFSPDGLFCATFDETAEEGRHPALLGFLAADALRAWRELDDGARRAAVLGAFADLFGPEALTPTHYVEQDWTADPWQHGAPVAFLPPGVLSRVGAALREPCGRIHWAGTEAAVHWTGYMDGAVRAGAAAAEAVVQRLREPAAV